MSRLADLQCFYRILDELEQRVGSMRVLGDSDGRMSWPDRGVYLFFEPGEVRQASGTGPRVVRVGTHALTTGAGTTLWRRLAQHRGVQSSASGNHRGSIFRLLVGQALIARDGLAAETWGSRSDAGKAGQRIGLSRHEVRELERPVERAVSAVLGAMPFLWVGVDDLPGPGSRRGFIERNAIALLSNLGEAPVDPPSEGWLGRFSDRANVRESGLWNNNHVAEAYDPGFLDVFEALAKTTAREA